MSEESRIGVLARPRALVVAGLAALVALTALVAAPGADAKAKKKAKTVPVKVMTRNIFLGADLGPALNANSFQAFTAANGAILREVDATDFPRRAIGLAQEIQQKKPDLIGIQEGAWWRTGPPPTLQAPYAQGPNGNFTATTDKYNFLQILLGALEDRGLNYEIAVEKVEFDFEAPTDYDNNPNTGLFGGEVMGRLTMRDAILVNEDSKVKAKLKNPQSGTYSSLYTPNIAGIDVPVTRGWTAGDITVQKGKGRSKVKRKFRFVNTHFEAFDDETQRPSIRALQATEVVNGPASKKRTIMLGDFNSERPGRATGRRAGVPGHPRRRLRAPGDERPAELLREQPVHGAAERVRPSGRPHRHQHGQQGEAGQLLGDRPRAGQRDLQLRPRGRLQQAEAEVAPVRDCEFRGGARKARRP